MMFIMNDEGMNGLMHGHVKLGADVSAAAGPVGRSASADAGYKAGILYLFRQQRSLHRRLAQRS